VSYNPDSKLKNQYIAAADGMISGCGCGFTGVGLMDDIANAAHIGKGEGARCFKRTLHMTPFSFLIGYRIDRAKELLSGSSKPVTEISFDCGFPSTNYFGKTFREKTGMTPSEYRLKYSIR